MISSILVPVDGSPEAEAGLDWARTAASRTNAEVAILSVVGNGASTGARDKASAEAYVAEQAREMSAAGVTARHEVASGAPPEIILARAGDCQVTVMTHRAGRWDFGGNLATVLREMQQPVLVVRSGGAGVEEGLGNPRILVPLDQPAFSRCVLHAVEMFARALNFGVVLCRVIKPVGPFLDPSNAPPEIAREIQAQFDVARHELAQDARELASPEKPEVVVAMGDPAREIVRTAGLCGAGLIAMATRGSASMSQVMGSTALAVLRSTRVPCLLVRPSGTKSPDAA